MYRVVLPVFVALGLLAWLVVGVFALRLHDVRTFWLTCSTALVGFGTRMLLLAIVSAVAFPLDERPLRFSGSSAAAPLSRSPS